MSLISLLKWAFTPQPERFTASATEMIDPKDAALLEAVRISMEEPTNDLGVQANVSSGNSDLGSGNVVHTDPGGDPSLVRNKALSDSEASGQRS